MKIHINKNTFLRLCIVSIFVLFILILFGNLDALTMDEAITGPIFLGLSPTITIGSLIIQQPSSTFLVMTLALYTFTLGLGYLKKGEIEFNWYMGINFVLWGIGAALAGISYQAFGYYLKCAQSTPCLFTDGFELMYMLVTVYSIHAILLAYASILPIPIKTKLHRFVLVSLISYSLFQGIGILLPNQFLVSYEGMLVFLSPSMILFIVFSYQNRHTLIHERLLKLWILFLGVNALYFVALFLNVQNFFDHYLHVWFNENDVLHITLLAWMWFFKHQIPKLDN